jgi:hypothetical protein
MKGRLPQGYRLATAEERLLVDAAGGCYLVRDWGDRAMACPSPRVKGQELCAVCVLKFGSDEDQEEAKKQLESEELAAPRVLIGDPCVGEAVRFTWYGKRRDGVVAKLRRKKVDVSFEYNGRKKILAVPLAELLP